MKQYLTWSLLSEKDIVFLVVGMVVQCVTLCTSQKNSLDAIEKTGNLYAAAIADPSHLSCVANDFGYNQVSLDILKPGEVRGTAY